MLVLVMASVVHKLCEFARVLCEGRGVRSYKVWVLGSPRTVSDTTFAVTPHRQGAGAAMIHWQGQEDEQVHSADCHVKGEIKGCCQMHTAESRAAIQWVLYS